MKPWTVVSLIAGTIFIFIGVLLFIFLRELNDPEIEGESGRVGLGLYFIPLLSIIIGVFIMFIPKKK
jgi:EamA domain-containing membrane protein RarD